MSKPANKVRGEVAISGFGEGAALRYDMDALERLQSAYDKKWLDVILVGLADFDMQVTKTCVEVALIGDAIPRKEGGIVDFSGMRDIDAVRTAIYDALFLQLYGKTFAEKKDQEEADYLESTKKRLKQIDEDPHLAALIFSQQFGKPVTAPDSAPESSAASPS